MDFSKLLARLCNADTVAGLDGALNVVKEYMDGFSKTTVFDGSLVCEMEGSSDYTVLLDAHIDQIGMIVTNVEKSFVKVAAIGGIDARILAAMRVKIYGKQEVLGVFCSVPPHLRKGESEVQAIDDMYIDTGLDNAADIISVGDRVVFAEDFVEMAGDKVTGKSLDNRAGVATLIACAKILSNKKLPVKCVFLFSDKEEIGGMGAKIEAFAINPQEAIVVDVSFGNTPDIPDYKTGSLGDGVMIGVSPILSQKVTDGLKLAAKNIDANYQTEVMGGKTGTNADVVSVTRSGVKCGLVSIPLRNMHTPVEIVDVNDIENTAKVLAEYILTQAVGGRK